MGCCPASAQKESQVTDGVTDLEAPALTGLDVYTSFEQSQPFYRIHIKQMNKCIDDAETEDGGEGFVTLPTLRKHLNTPAWKALDDSNSQLSQILLSQFMKDEKKGHDANQISADYLRMFALMHCVGTNMDKAKAMYLILQDGGFEKHDQISAGDKDFEPAFKKLCTLASSELFALAGDVGKI